MRDDKMADNDELMMKRKQFTHETILPAIREVIRLFSPNIRSFRII